MKGFQCLFEEGKIYNNDGLWYKIVKGKLFVRDEIQNMWLESSLNDLINSEYKEIKPEVTWQKALEVWVTGKMIMCIYDGDEYKIHPDDVIDRELVAKGKWYII